MQDRTCTTVMEFQKFHMQLSFPDSTRDSSSITCNTCSWVVVVFLLLHFVSDFHPHETAATVWGAAALKPLSCIAIASYLYIAELCSLSFSAGALGNTARQGARVRSVGALKYAAPGRSNEEPDVSSSAVEKDMQWRTKNSDSELGQMEEIRIRSEGEQPGEGNRSSGVKKLWRDVSAVAEFPTSSSASSGKKLWRDVSAVAEFPTLGSMSSGIRAGKMPPRRNRQRPVRDLPGEGNRSSGVKKLWRDVSTVAEFPTSGSTSSRKKLWRDVSAVAEFPTSEIASTAVIQSDLHLSLNPAVQAILCASNSVERREAPFWQFSEAEARDVAWRASLRRLRRAFSPYKAPTFQAFGALRMLSLLILFYLAPPLPNNLKWLSKYATCLLLNELLSHLFSSLLCEIPKSLHMYACPKGSKVKGSVLFYTLLAGMALESDEYNMKLIEQEIPDVELSSLPLPFPLSLLLSQDQDEEVLLPLSKISTSDIRATVVAIKEEAEEKGFGLVLLASAGRPGRTEELRQFYEAGLRRRIWRGGLRVRLRSAQSGRSHEGCAVAKGAGNHPRGAGFRTKWTRAGSFLHAGDWSTKAVLGGGDHRARVEGRKRARHGDVLPAEAAGRSISCKCVVAGIGRARQCRAWDCDGHGVQGAGAELEAQGVGTERRVRVDAQGAEARHKGCSEIDCIGRSATGADLSRGGAKGSRRRKLKKRVEQFLRHQHKRTWRWELCLGHRVETPLATRETRRTYRKSHGKRAESLTPADVHASPGPFLAGAEAAHGKRPPQRRRRHLRYGELLSPSAYAALVRCRGSRGSGGGGGGGWRIR
ncbi:hypothetical protein M5K25_007643 [Dendrobium thyrsiflorum]|uniref:Uncharacterized protein n=1 Tax=Dendrobium thyrsiflorum TaxID=117978 RepID=A0ABD0VEK3_DENTH